MAILNCLIVTYNGEEVIERCINSLLMQKGVDMELRIYDNASKDSTKEIIREFETPLKLIEGKINLGFGKANNILLKQVSNDCEYVLLLNQDACFTKQSDLAELISLMNHYTLDLISPCYIGEDGQIDAEFKRLLQNNLYEGIENSALMPIHFSPAACWLLRKNSMEKTGLFCPLFFHYGEDKNYMDRMRYLGLSSAYCPTIKVQHPFGKNYSKEKHRAYLLSLLLNPNIRMTAAIRRILCMSLGDNFRKRPFQDIFMFAEFLPKFVQIYSYRKQSKESS